MNGLLHGTSCAEIEKLSTKIVTGIAISHLFSRYLWVWWHVGKYYSSETSTLITTTFYNTFLSIFVMLSLLLLNLLPGKIWVVCIWAQIPRKTFEYHDICSSHVLQVVNNVLYYIPRSIVLHPFMTNFQQIFNPYRAKQNTWKKGFSIGNINSWGWLSFV